MTYNHPTKRTIAALLSLSVLWFSIFTSTVHADLITTSEMQQQMNLQYDREQLHQLLNQADVRDQLTRMGVDPAMAQERVDQLTADELAQLNANINELPAGSGLIGLVVLFVLVFIVTDIIGATDIFPFVHPVNTKK